MPLVLVPEDIDDGSIPMRDLGEGQLAEIVKWPGVNCHVGQVVIRYPCSIGGITFSDSFPVVPQDDDVRVRVLKNGTELVVRENE